MKGKQFVLNAVSELKGLRGNFKQKAERNIRLYEDTLNISLDSIREDTAIGFYKDGSRYDTTVDMSLNVIKSCIDTLTSKIASVKVRPFFNTVNGSFKDVRIVRQAQQYFDQSFEYKNMNKTVSDCFRNACIFDTGVIYINPKDHSIKNILPWQVYYRPAEKTYDKLTRIYYERKQMPTTLLPDYKGEEDYVAYGEYYDIVNHIHAEMYSDGKVIIHEYNADVLPFIFLNYCSPIVGGSSNSIVDLLLSIQIEINALANTVKDASQLTPANTVFVPEGSNISVRKFNNGIGNVVGYSASPSMTTSPVTVATPSFIDPQYMKTIEELKETAYELVGISQLSATSQKPNGLDSGIALQTMENIESDRFEMQLNAVIRAYSDIAKTCMKVFDPADDILPQDQYRASIKWSDIVEEEKNMKVQFSSADALSKDPSIKLQILQSLAQSGIIPASTISRYLEIPDLEKGYSVLNNTWEAVQTVIERCIDGDVYEIPTFVPYTLLQQEIINTQLSLFAADPYGNMNDIGKLGKLFEVTVNASNKINNYLAEQQAQAQQQQFQQQLEQQAQINAVNQGGQQ